MTERRKWKRYPIAYPIECGRGCKDPSITLRDISKGGVAFTSGEGVREDDKLDLRIFLKNRMFILKAIVVYTKKIKEKIYNTGVKFCNAPKEFLAMLEKEIGEITEIHRESNLYEHKDISFKKASDEYLKKPSI